MFRRRHYHIKFSFRIFTLTQAAPESSKATAAETIETPELEANPAANVVSCISSDAQASEATATQTQSNILLSKGTLAGNVSSPNSPLATLTKAITPNCSIIYY